MLLQKSHSKSINIDPKNVILLGSQSTMDLFYNTKMVGNCFKDKKNMRLHINGGKMLITHNAQVSYYKSYAWFDQKDITKLIALKNIINWYHVTYDSLHEMFIFHLEEHGRNNIHFIMHDSGLHYYFP